MPLYEYQCANDGTFERMQKFSDPPLTECPKCGGPVEKLLSAPAIQFKGSGWYITDYARKSGGESAKRDEGGKAKAASEAKDSSSGSSSSGASGGGTSGGAGGGSSTGAGGSGSSEKK